MSFRKYIDHNMIFNKNVILVKLFAKEIFYRTQLTNLTLTSLRRASIAQWFRLRLSPAVPGSNSKHPFMVKLYTLLIIVLRKGRKESKRVQVWPIYFKH